MVTSLSLLFLLLFTYDIVVSFDDLNYADDNAFSSDSFDFIDNINEILNLTNQTAAFKLHISLNYDGTRLSFHPPISKLPTEFALDSKLLILSEMAILDLKLKDKFFKLNTIRLDPTHAGVFDLNTNKETSESFDSFDEDTGLFGGKWQKRTKIRRFVAHLTEAGDFCFERENFRRRGEVFFNDHTYCFRVLPEYLVGDASRIINIPLLMLNALDDIYQEIVKQLGTIEENEDEDEDDSKRRLEEEESTSEDGESEYQKQGYDPTVFIGINALYESNGILISEVESIKSLFVIQHIASRIVSHLSCNDLIITLPVSERLKFYERASASERVAMVVHNAKQRNKCLRYAYEMQYDTRPQYNFGGKIVLETPTQNRSHFTFDVPQKQLKLADVVINIGPFKNHRGYKKLKNETNVESEYSEPPITIITEGKNVTSMLGPPKASNNDLIQYEMTMELKDAYFRRSEGAYITFNASKSGLKTLGKRIKCTHFIFDFGDGQSDESEDGVFEEHHYLRRGYYEINLTLSCGHGQQNGSAQFILLISSLRYPTAKIITSWNDGQNSKASWINREITFTLETPYGNSLTPFKSIIWKMDKDSFMTDSKLSLTHEYTYYTGGQKIIQVQLTDKLNRRFYATYTQNVSDFLYDYAKESVRQEAEKAANKTPNATEIEHLDYLKKQAEEHSRQAQTENEETKNSTTQKPTEGHRRRRMADDDSEHDLDVTNEDLFGISVRKRDGSLISFKKFDIKRAGFGMLYNISKQVTSDFFAEVGLKSTKKLEIEIKTNENGEISVESMNDFAVQKVVFFELKLRNGECCVIDISAKNQKYKIFEDEDLGGNDRQIVMLQSDKITVVPSAALKEHEYRIKDIVFYVDLIDDWHQYEQGEDITSHSKLSSMHDLLYASGEIVNILSSLYYVCVSWTEVHTSKNVKASKCSHDLYFNSAHFNDDKFDLNALDTFSSVNLDTSDLLNLQLQHLKDIVAKIDDYRSELATQKSDEHRYFDEMKNAAAASVQYLNNLERIETVYQAQLNQMGANKVQKSAFRKQLSDLEQLIEHEEEYHEKFKESQQKFDENEVEQVKRRRKEIEQQIVGSRKMILRMKMNMKQQEAAIDGIDDQINQIQRRIN